LGDGTQALPTELLGGGAGPLVRLAQRNDKAAVPFDSTVQHVEQHVARRPVEPGCHCLFVVLFQRLGPDSVVPIRFTSLHSFTMFY